MTTTRRKVAAALLYAFGPLAVAWALIWPDNPEDTKAAFASAAAHHSAWNLAATLFVLSFAVAVPGLLASIGRGNRAVTIGATLAAIGFVCNTIAGTFSAFMSLLATQPDQAAMMHVWNGLDTLPVTVAVSILIIVGHVGLIVASFGLWRSHVAGLWMPIVMMVGMLGEAAVGPANHWAEVGVAALVGVAFIGYARAVVAPGAAVVSEPVAVPA